MYGDKNGIINERRALEPINIYGKSKLSGEYLIKKYSKVHNFRYAILRFFNVAGSDLKIILELLITSH